MRDQAHDTPSSPDFFAALAADAAQYAPSEDELRERSSREQIEQRRLHLAESKINGALTDEDIEWLVTDELPLKTHALTTVRRWHKSKTSAAPLAIGAPLLPRPLNVFALVGLTSRGKTMAGGWLISRVGGRYVTAESLARAFVGKDWRDGYTRKLFQELVETRCVVVDDLGGELEAHVGKAAIFEFVNQRAGNGRTWTLLTANLDESEFAQRYGERTIRRIQHCGAVVQVTGPDLRRKGGA
jgi:hypothetical protein